VDVDVDGLQTSGYGLRVRDQVTARVKASRLGRGFALPSALRGRSR